MATYLSQAGRRLRSWQPVVCHADAVEAQYRRLNRPLALMLLCPPGARPSRLMQMVPMVR